jgi:transposase
VAALFYSLIESAELCGVEPKAHLLQTVRAALATPGTATLPHTLEKRRRFEFRSTSPLLA